MYDLPYELVEASFSDDDINILIGENGSGKSTLLDEASRYFFKANFNVIAIANTIYDKFSSRNRNFNILRAASGKSSAKKILIECFKYLGKGDMNRLGNIAMTLQYAGFDPNVSIQIKGVNRSFQERIFRSDFPEKTKERLQFFLYNYTRQTNYPENIVTLDFQRKDVTNALTNELIDIFRYEKELKSLDLISGINLYLHRDGTPIPLNRGSSGELTIITSLIYITTLITEKSVILIDEPENSLHPKWQIEYIKTITSLFYFYQPKIIIATHSPLIINGAEISNNNVKIFKGENSIFKLRKENMTNVEEIYEDYFDLTTPENRYISEFIVDKMNLLASNSITIIDYENALNEIKENSYDKRQIGTLDDLIKVGKDIVNQNK